MYKEEITYLLNRIEELEKQIREQSDFIELLLYILTYRHDEDISDDENSWD